MEDVPAGAPRLTTRWGLAWIGLGLALALHVVDEALGGFLAFYNPIAEAVRARWPLPFPPTFTFDAWLGGLAVAVVALLALSACAFRGFRWMRPLSYALGVFMIANGLVHLTASVALGRPVAGTYSAPLLVAAAVYLMVATPRRTATAT
ncbi:MAG: hypothetical protein JSW43_10705 [Gemmatimonadota bacterium]|nr:MAG: hypothetical protein JSW43_10705 [Gemmatimonadota bacterium]